MNTAYTYDPKETSAFINRRIYLQLEKRHWSVKTLSDKAGIPYETLKKLLSMKTENTSFHNIARIALAFECNLTYLTGSFSSSSAADPDTAMNAYDSSIGASYQTCDAGEHNSYIPVLCCREEDCIFASQRGLLSNTLDIETFPPSLQREVDYGLLVTSYCYHPVYYEQDILLISRKRSPRIGEIAVFSHQEKFFIRQLGKQKSQFILSPVNGLGCDIIISDFSDWQILGYVIGIHRN